MDALVLEPRFNRQRQSCVLKTSFCSSEVYGSGFIGQILLYAKSLTACKYISECLCGQQAM